MQERPFIQLGYLYKDDAEVVAAVSSLVQSNELKNITEKNWKKTKTEKGSQRTLIFIRGRELL